MTAITAAYPDPRMLHTQTKHDEWMDDDGGIKKQGLCVRGHRQMRSSFSSVAVCLANEALGDGSSRCVCFSLHTPLLTNNGRIVSQSESVSQKKETEKY